MHDSAIAGYRRPNHVIVTHNDGVLADTFNVDICPWQSQWCRRFCYGNKLSGMAYLCPWTSYFEWGASARKSGYFRPFTVRGDIPEYPAERRACLAVLRKLLPLYKKVWLPTRGWRDTKCRGLLYKLLREYDHLNLTLSFDGSMNLEELVVLAKRFAEKFPGRVMANVVTEVAHPLPLFEVPKVKKLLETGAFPCTKTYSQTYADCDDCGRVCWGEREVEVNQLLGVPVVALRYHR